MIKDFSCSYRLAPEYLYPIPLEDCLTAARYFIKHAQDFGVDKNLIGVKGIYDTMYKI